jgi:nitroreductase
MDALQALLSRVSPARLAPNEPDPRVIEQILAAGLRAADHGRLRPWRFLVVRGEARHRFGELLAEGLKSRNPEAGVDMLEAERNKALRAPVIVIVMAVIRDNPNIPDIEQIVSAGAAAQNMLVAAHALGLGGFWRTGAAAYDPRLKKALGASEKNVIVGFLYLGNVATAGNEKEPDPEGVVAEWTGPPQSEAPPP